MISKDRLKLCESFAKSKTIAELEKENSEKYWESVRLARELSREFNRLNRAIRNSRPWYKKIFD